MSLKHKKDNVKLVDGMGHLLIMTVFYIHYRIAVAEVLVVLVFFQLC